MVENGITFDRKISELDGLKSEETAKMEEEKSAVKLHIDNGDINKKIFDNFMQKKAESEERIRDIENQKYKLNKARATLLSMPIHSQTEKGIAEIFGGDIVYQYAKKNNDEELLNKLITRSLTLGEYLNILEKCLSVQEFLNIVNTHYPEYIKDKYGDTEKMYENLFPVENKPKRRKRVNIERPVTTLSKLNVEYKTIDGIILPTKGEESGIKRTGSRAEKSNELDGEYANKINILLSKVLIPENGFTAKDYDVIVGQESRNMVRKTTYVVVEIPQRNKMIILNNGYGEASFLCDTIFDKETLTSLSKEELMNMHSKDVKKLEFENEEDWVSDMLKRVDTLSFTVAEKLIKSGEIVTLLSNLEKFEGLNHKEIAMKLIEEGKGRYVARNLDKFEGLDKEIAEKLIEEGETRYVVRYSDKFEGLVLDKEIAEKLIEEGKGRYVAENLDKFEGLVLDKEMEEKQIEEGKGRFVAENPKKSELLDKKRAEEMIDEGWGLGYVVENLDKFEGLDKEIAEKLVDKGCGLSVLKNLEKFEGLNKDAPKKRFEEGKLRYVAKYLDKFEGLSHKEIAEKLIEEGEGEYVAENLTQFEGSSHKEIAMKLIEKGKWKYVVENLTQFEGLNHKEIAMKLIEEGKGRYVAENLDKFEGLDKEIAEKLIEEGEGEYVVKNLDKFEGLDKEIAEKLIKKGKGRYVAENLDKFEGLDKEIAEKLIEKGEGEYVAENLDKFKGLNHKKIADKLIENGLIKSLAENLSKFQNLSKRTAKILVENRIGSVSGNLKSFEKLDNEIAETLVDNKYYNAVVRNIDNFENLSNKVLLSLLVNCPKRQLRIFAYRSVFINGGNRDETLLATLQKDGNDLEYRKLKNFYDKITFEKEKEDFVSDMDFSKGFNISDAKKAIKYGKGTYLIESLDKYSGNYKELVNLLIRSKLIQSLKDHLRKLRGKDLDWHKLVLELSRANAYNEIIQNADLFEKGGISSSEIGLLIIKNCNPKYRDAVSNLEEEDNEDWNRINYNLDFYDYIINRKREEFFGVINYFKSEFDLSDTKRKLPIKLKDLANQNFGKSTIDGYKDIFE